MNRYKAVLAALGTAVLITGAIIFMIQGDIRTTKLDPENTACGNALDQMSQEMEIGEEREIPKVCFDSEGKPVTSRLSDAEPGDNFRRTEDSYEAVN